jgi:predicted DNA-binding transcriptional regulator AlpA
MNSRQKMRPVDAASFLGMSASTLAKMRLRGDGPPYAKLGKRIVIYDQTDLEEWVDARRRLSTSSESNHPISK